MERYSLVILKRPANGGAKVADPEALQRQHIEPPARRWPAPGSWSWPVRSTTRRDPRMRGLCIYRTSLDEARRLAQEDPAVKAGRLEVEVLSWWVEKGAITFPSAEAMAPGQERSGRASGDGVGLGEQLGDAARERARRRPGRRGRRSAPRSSRGPRRGRACRCAYRRRRGPARRPRTTPSRCAPARGRRARPVLPARAYSASTSDSSVVAMVPAPAPGTQRPTSERSRTGSTGAGRWATGRRQRMRRRAVGQHDGNGSPATAQLFDQRVAAVETVSAGVTSTEGRSHAIQPAASSGSVVPRTAGGAEGMTQHRDRGAQALGRRRRRPGSGRNGRSRPRHGAATVPAGAVRGCGGVVGSRRRSVATEIPGQSAARGWATSGLGARAEPRGADQLVEGSHPGSRRRSAPARRATEDARRAPLPRRRWPPRAPGRRPAPRGARSPARGERARPRCAPAPAGLRAAPGAACPSSAPAPALPSPRRRRRARRRGPRRRSGRRCPPSRAAAR